MHDSQEIFTLFKSLVKEYPLPSLVELITFMRDNPELRRKKMRFLETIGGDQRLDRPGPVNDNVSWNFLRIQNHFSNVGKICEELEKSFGIVVFCSSYYTPKNSKALPCHFDPYELLGYQVSGSKHWQIWPQLPESIYAADMNPPQEALLKEWLKNFSPVELTVSAGECFHVSARKPHSVTTSETDSVSHMFGFTGANSKFVGY